MHIFSDKMHHNQNFNKFCKFYISKAEVREIVQNVHVCKALRIFSRMEIVHNLAKVFAVKMHVDFGCRDRLMTQH